MKITHALRGEHGAINPLLDCIDAEPPSASVETLHAHVRMLSASLLPHAGIEDEILRPAIVDYLPPSPDGPDAPTDHERITEILRRAGAARDAETVRRLLAEAVTETRRHFRKEEEKIFPIAESNLSDSVQRVLGVRWANRRGVRLERAAALVKRAS